MENVNLKRANLKGVDLTNAIINGKIDLREAKNLDLQNVKKN